METLNFSIGQPVIDPPQLEVSSKHHMLVNIDADVIINIGNKLVFNENINFIEFACALVEWVQADLNDNFRFNSMDFEEDGIIEFTRNNDGYLFSSSLNLNSTETKITKDIINSFAYNFYKQAKQSTKKYLGLEFEKYGL